MSPNESRRKAFILIAVPFFALGGCVTEKGPTPPYFKDIYQATRTPAAGVESGTLPPASFEAQAPPAEAKKTAVKIVAVPNPFLKETLTAAAEKDQAAKTPAGQGPAKEQPAPMQLSVQAAAGDVQVTVENMPVYEFVNLAFGELLKLNYTVNPDVQAAAEKITLNMNRKMSGKEFFPFVVDLLRKNGLEVRDENGMLFVSRRGQAAGEPSSAGTEVYVGNVVPALPPQKRITIILATSYVPATQILQVVRQLQMISGDVRVESLLNSQAVALTGTVASLEKIVALFNQLDRVTFVGREFNLIYFDYINVVDFDKKLKEVLPALGIPVARIPTESGLLTIPFEKINALLVVSSQKQWLETLLFWKEKLDAVESMGDEMQLFVFQPKNRPAEELVDVLKSVASGGNASQSAAAAVPDQQRPAPALKAAPAPVRVEGAQIAALPGKGFTAILDKGRNAVIISASPANFKLIRNILTQLDTPPRQVLIEATIMEVTLTDNLQYGVEWYLKHSINSGGSGNYEGTLSTLGGLALGGSGLNYAITKLPGDFQAKVNAFASKNMINIVSTPHIAMLDGREATITVGTEVPIVTAEASAADIAGSSGSTTSPSILRSVQYRNTGTILRVKPVINSEGALTIEINQELSEAQTNSVSSIDSPLILNRSIHTTLTCKSGDTVLIGGLISTNKSRGVSKVPILGDIPYLGNLFKTTSVGSTKTELIVQLTPYILNDMEQLDEITKKFKESAFMQDQ